MQLSVTRHVDAAEPNPDGSLDWRYEFDLYRFTEGAIALIFRSYTDEPLEVHLLAVEAHGVRRAPALKELDCELTHACVAHLRALGKVRIRRLGERGYVELT